MGKKGNGEMKLNRYPNRLEMKRIRAYASTLSATPHLRVRTVRTEIFTRRSGGAESGEIRFAE